jgi:hypothetical protein
VKDGQTTKWITYERIGHGQFTQLADEVPPRLHWDSRPATKQEISDEQEKRKRQAAEKAKNAEFEARPDYKDAKAIASILEWITSDKHPLDSLKPEEWVELRRRLEGKTADWSWQCNLCGSDEFTSAVSEDDLADDKMSCAGCGGTEFHKAVQA